MSKYVLIPDSFKGTLSSAAICRVMAEEICALEPDARIVSIPVADGGEGTVEAFLTAVGGERIEVACKGPYFEDITGYFAMLPGGIAVVEMAVAAGLPMVGERRNAEATTTYGVGQLIAAALDRGAKQVILGLGGSATNDGGCGAAAALGVEFRNAAGETFIPVGGTLKDIVSVSLAHAHSLIKNVPFTTMCDIDNPLCGETGASAVFGPQKGADEAMAARLDAGLRHLADVVARDLKRDILHLPGSGAAGGFGGGSVAFFNSVLRMGIDIVLDITQFDRMAADADLVLTGEGKLDGQSLRGKVVIGVARRARQLGVPVPSGFSLVTKKVARRARQLGVPVAALVGASETDVNAVYDEGVSGVFPINPMPQPFEAVREHAEENLRFTVSNLIRYTERLR